MDKVREEFEKWAKQFFKLEVEDWGEYIESETHWVWLAWRASREAIVVNLPEHCKGNALTVSELKEQLDKEGIKYDF